MPCRSYEPNLGSIDHERTVLLRQKIDQLSAMLCKLCGLHSQLGAPFDLPDDVAAWWESHQEAEAKEAYNLLVAVYEGDDDDSLYGELIQMPRDKREALIDALTYLQE